MSATYPKSAFVYGQVRRSLQAGSFIPGQRLDPSTLALEFDSSPTPVRFALYRLVGEGLLEDRARSGLRVPLPNEVVLRDLYDWMQRLLCMACDIGNVSHLGPDPAPERPDSDADEARCTWQLFDAIARLAEQRSLLHAIRRTNDRLAPIRRAERGILDDAAWEYHELLSVWQKRDVDVLKSAIILYHQRRMQAVPDIVASLSAAAEHIQ